MQTIGILAPSQEELAPILAGICVDHTEPVGKLSLITGHLGELRLYLLNCSIGKSNAALGACLLINHCHPDALVLAGVSGGIRKGLHIGDTLLGAQVAHHDVQSRFVTNNPPFLPSPWMAGDPALLAAFEQGVKQLAPDYTVRPGKLVTGEDFIDQEGRERIIAQFDPDCVDMETAAAAQVAFVLETPFLAIRSITDTQEESGLATFAENLDCSSGHAAAVLLAGLGVLSHPQD